MQPDAVWQKSINMKGNLHQFVLVLYEHEYEYEYKFAGVVDGCLPNMCTDRTDTLRTAIRNGGTPAKHFVHA